MSRDRHKMETGTRLEIFRSERRLHHCVGDRCIKAYPIAVGKHATPTPLGHYRVVNKVINPGGVLGTRWLGLDIPGGIYGIHGNNNPSSIGKFISNGCIRMYNQDVEQIFTEVGIGTPVLISDNSDGHFSLPGSVVSDTTTGQSDKQSGQPSKAKAPATKTPPATTKEPEDQSQPQTGGRQHIVRPGDSLWKIAKTYGVTVDAIVAANNLSNPNVLFPGQTLIIP